MKRLQAAESSIKVHQETIETERDLRKQSSQQMKDKITQLQDIVDTEKKNLSDKVSAELGVTLQ